MHFSSWNKICKLTATLNYEVSSGTNNKGVFCSLMRPCSQIIDLKMWVIKFHGKQVVLYFWPWPYPVDLQLHAGQDQVICVPFHVAYWCEHGLRFRGQNFRIKHIISAEATLNNIRLVLHNKAMHRFLSLDGNKVLVNTRNSILVNAHIERLHIVEMMMKYIINIILNTVMLLIEKLKEESNYNSI